MTANPYSFVTNGGVSNTRVRVTDDDASLAQLVDGFAKPLQLDVASVTYHNATKKEKGSYKKVLPYFVGGTMDGRRDDKNVLARTMITLDIEQADESGEQPPHPLDVVKKLKQLKGEGWVYTSIGHTPARPRYRVVLPLGRPIEDGSVEDKQGALHASTLKVAKLLDLEAWTTPESWVLSQPMYLPAKLKGGVFYSEYVPGKSWAPVFSKVGKERKAGQPADIPDERPDPVLAAIKAANLYLNEDQKHKGKHYITCPFVDQHEAENDTQTVYYEPHYDGNPRAAVKCFDTAPDTDGHPHLTFNTLVRWLKQHGHMTEQEQLQAGVLEETEDFFDQASVGRMLDTEPTPREWAIPQFAPVGKVTVVAGPGGQGKSLLMLHLQAHASMGLPWSAFKPTELKSVYVSYEDDFQELHGRVHRLTTDMRTYDDGVLDLLSDVQGSIRKNMYVYAAEDNAQAWLLLVKPDRFASPERTARVEWLVETLKSRNIKMLVLDPAVYTHQLEENNIADMASYMQTLSYIGKHAGCAVVVLHHMNKSSSWASIDDINQGGLRGASSFADNARSVAICVSMSIKDAALFGLPEDSDIASKYLIFKHVKHNYSASLGTLVFERQGPRLIPRPDITRLNSSQVAEAKDNHKAQQTTQRIQSYIPRTLQTLADHDGPVSQNQVAHAMDAKPATIKAVLVYCEQQDYIEITEGPNRSRMHELTPEGKAYLKLLKKESKK